MADACGQTDIWPGHSRRGGERWHATPRTAGPQRQRVFTHQLVAQLVLIFHGRIAAHWAAGFVVAPLVHLHAGRGLGTRPSLRSRPPNARAGTRDLFWCSASARARASSQRASAHVPLSSGELGGPCVPGQYRTSCLGCLPGRVASFCCGFMRCRARAVRVGRATSRVAAGRRRLGRRRTGGLCVHRGTLRPIPVTSSKDDTASPSSPQRGWPTTQHAQSRRRCGCGRAEPSSGADVGGASATPGVDGAGVSPVPVQMWAGRAQGFSLRVAPRRSAGLFGAHGSVRRCCSERMACRCCRMPVSPG
jgi:hypothetical protein